MNSYGLEYLKNKDIKLIEQKKLNQLKKGEMFLYKGMLCCAIMVSKYYVTYENEILQQFSTTKTENTVHTVEWTKKYQKVW